jgi:hypothetical protein
MGSPAPLPILGGLVVLLPGMSADAVDDTKIKNKIISVEAKAIEYAFSLFFISLSSFPFLLVLIIFWNCRN